MPFHAMQQLWEDVEETSRVLKRLGYITYQVRLYILLMAHPLTFPADHINLFT